MVPGRNFAPCFNLSAGLGRGPVPRGNSMSAKLELLGVGKEALSC
jgi:hypothetical protein